MQAPVAGDFRIADLEWGATFVRPNDSVRVPDGLRFATSISLVPTARVELDRAEHLALALWSAARLDDG